MDSGRPKRNTNKGIASSLSLLAPPSLFPTLPLPSTAPMSISCTICMDILDRPLELECAALCACCATRWLTISGGTDCPCCSSPLIGHTHPPSRLTLNVLGSQLVGCSDGCHRMVRAECYAAHLESKCQGFFEHSIHSPSRPTPDKNSYREVLP